MSQKVNPEDLVIGAEHLDKIGEAVCVDVDAASGRKLFCGVFHGARDEYGDGGDLARTILFVGSQQVELDWDRDETLAVLIKTHP